MPESSAIHHEQEQLAQFSREYDRRDVNLETYEEDDDDIVQDIGELLGFRVTGGRDFFMPITIFHVGTYCGAKRCCGEFGLGGVEA